MAIMSRSGNVESEGEMFQGYVEAACQVPSILSCVSSTCPRDSRVVYGVLRAWPVSGTFPSWPADRCASSAFRPWQILRIRTAKSVTAARRSSCLLRLLPERDDIPFRIRKVRHGAPCSDGMLRRQYLSTTHLDGLQHLVNRFCLYND